MSVVDAALRYLVRGWQLVEIESRGKRPRRDNWPNLRYQTTDVPRHFKDANVGLLLGEPSGWLIDVDLDCDLAVQLAPQYLPPTGAITGRTSRPRSHWWYVAKGQRACKYRLPTDRGGDVVCEIRSTGHQTVVGPSTHPDGEPYEELVGQPAEIEAADLERAVAALAAAVLEASGVASAAAQAAQAGADDASPSVPPAERPEAPDDVLARAIAYVTAMPPSISGHGGHNAAFAAATALVHGFGLSDQQALQVFELAFNARCDPPWSDSEVRHKIRQAARTPHSQPFGWLRLGDVEDQTVDLTEFDLVGASDVDEADIEVAPEADAAIPPELLDVPGLIGEVMRWNLATAPRRQPALALAGAIALMGTLAGRKVRDERGNRTNLYLLGLAASGDGKDHARKINKRVLFLSQQSHLEGPEDLASDSGLVSAIENQPSVLFQLDEIGRILATVGDSSRNPHLYHVVTTLLRLFTSAGGEWKGKAYADREKNVVIQQPHAVLFGTSVPESFFQSLTSESMDDGFVARLLVFEGDFLPARQWTSMTEPPQSIVDVANWWRTWTPGGDLASEMPDPHVVPTTDAARELWNQYGDWCDAQRRSRKHSALWARAEEKACRLALIYACSRDPQNLVVDEAAVCWACDLVTHLTFRTIAIADAWVSNSKHDRTQKELLRKIARSGGSMTKTEVTRCLQHLAKRERDDLLISMVDARLLQITKVSPAGGGRPKEIYEVVR